jgi:hypothetical protein
MDAQLAQMLVTYRIADAHRESASERLAADVRTASRPSGIVSRFANRGSRPNAPAPPHATNAPKSVGRQVTSGRRRIAVVPTKRNDFVWSELSRTAL